MNSTFDMLEGGLADLTLQDAASADDLDELLAESEALTHTAKEVEDLDDLDQLLEESLTFHEAKKAKNQGRKLTQAQQDLLDANRMAAEMAMWREEVVVAHFIKTRCACGREHQRFNGWYVLAKHRRTTEARLTRKGQFSPTLPRQRFTTLDNISHCEACTDFFARPEASVASIPLLSVFKGGEHVGAE